MIIDTELTRSAPRRVLSAGEFRSAGSIEIASGVRDNQECMKIEIESELQENGDTVGSPCEDR